MRLLSALYGQDVDPFRLLKKVTTVENPKDLTEDGVLLLHGGADISPSIYKQRSNSRCFAQDRPSRRDEQEIALVKQATKMGIPIIGICRGAQLLCAMDGGYLMQHIDNHIGGYHTITDTETKKEYISNSCHHQMMVPTKYSKVLAEHTGSTTGIDENNFEVIIDSVPEIVHFPRMNAIGIQGHPEWMASSNFTKYCANLIEEHLYEKG